MLQDDPIAYAVIDDKKEIVESYVSYSFKDSNIEDDFKDFLKKI